MCKCCEMWDWDFGNHKWYKNLKSHVISQGKSYWPWSYWKFAQAIEIVLTKNLVVKKSIEWFFRNIFTPMWLKVTLLIRFSVQILYRMQRKCMQIPSWKGWAISVVSVPTYVPKDSMVAWSVEFVGWTKFMVISCLK